MWKDLSHLVGTSPWFSLCFTQFLVDWRVHCVERKLEGEIQF